MEIYICKDEFEKNKYEVKGLYHQAKGTDPVTKNPYWVYIKTDYFNKLNSEYRKGEQ